MPVKLVLQILRRFLQATQSVGRSRKLLLASSAFGNTGYRANMFHDANRAFRHFYSLPQTGLVLILEIRTNPRDPLSFN
jgi:hypothetical protein